MEKQWEYEDIVHLPHHVSQTRPQMSMTDRAAQFSPFAALTGYEAAIRSTARQVCEAVEAQNTGISDEELFLQEEGFYRG